MALERKSQGPVCFYVIFCQCFTLTVCLRRDQGPQKKEKRRKDRKQATHSFLLLDRLKDVGEERDDDSDCASTVSSAPSDVADANIENTGFATREALVAWRAARREARHRRHESY